MRNAVNRRVNCETANITKTVNAASKQIDDILYIKEHYGFDNLADNLRMMAELRLEYPDASLKELGGYATPAVGKSGVNHRLRKLCELAEKLRGEFSMKKALFIINPHSGKGLIKNHLLGIVDILVKNGCEVTVYPHAGARGRKPRDA